MAVGPALQVSRASRCGVGREPVERPVAAAVVAALEVLQAVAGRAARLAVRGAQRKTRTPLSMSYPDLSTRSQLVLGAWAALEVPAAQPPQ